MWTPKRIFLLTAGFVAFTLVYFLYSLTSLGRINTLPPLPAHYKIRGNGTSWGDMARTPNVRPTPLEKKMEMAFGAVCKELKWPVQLELNSKSMVLAAGKFERVEDGRVLLEPMSLALFGKKKVEGRGIEINTLKCDKAYIRFDRPITSLSPSEMNGRKIVEAQLFGAPPETPIRITNNRRTISTVDDLVVTINAGPLYYIEKTQIVKTAEHVHIEDGEKTFRDGRLIPPKAVIDAEGMEMELATSPPPPRPGYFVAAKSKNDSISGVKRIVLKEAVDMNLGVSGGTPFPGPGSDKSPNRAKSANAGKNPAPQEPARILINCPGRFEYLLFKDHDEARFDVVDEGELPISPQDVTVQRLNGEEIGNDMLVCKHLELRIKRGNNETPAAKDAKSSPTDEQGLEIETAHATGPYVTLTSDAEKLDAHGNDFFHDNLQKLSILKGTPYMEANKEDNLIQAPELRIRDIPLAVAAAPVPGAGNKATNATAKTYQQVEASGPGSIHMMSKTSNKRTTHAYWNEKLVSTHDRERDLDLLILTGSARFEDTEHDQFLKAETLNVWLLPNEKKEATAGSPAAVAKASPQTPSPSAAKQTAPVKPASSSRRPHHIEALRNVFTRSNEMNIHDAARLVVHFIDVPLDRMPPPTSTKDKPAAQPLDRKPSPPPAASPTPPLAPPTTTKGNAPGPAKTNPPGQAPTAPPRPGPDPSRPIDLSARSIEARVLRCEERMVLDHLWAEGGALEQLDKRGGVRVRQEPPAPEPGKPREDGVDIECNTLNMTCTVDGNILVVTGDLAHLQMNKIHILGPEVHIDQVANKVWVEGRGVMQMQSNTTLENKPLEHPVPLIVHWKDRMLFSGIFAWFDGDIQAEQGKSLLACQHLQVIFDRPISLKQGMHGDQPAKVSKLVGDEEVRAEDQTFVGDKLEKYQMLLGSAIAMKTLPREDESSSSAAKANDANEVKLTGPGSVRILQRGGSEMGGLPGTPSPTPPRPPGSVKPSETGQEMKLTFIRFEKLMQANSLTNVASFWESVRVLNMACDDPHREIDLDAIVSSELPTGAMYLRCNQLKVGTYQKQVSATPKQVRTYQVMEAKGQVVVESQEFTAQCDFMTFNEEKDTVTFHGENGNEAVLSKVTFKGAPPQVFRGKKIIYHRSTGAMDGLDIRSIRG